jgi:cytochrome P450
MEYIGGKSVTDNIRLVNYAAEQLQFKIDQEKADKEKGKTPRKDMMHYLLNAEDQKTGTKPTPEELLADSVLYLVAGSDTVAAALAASFFYLIHNPAALARATAEVRAAFKSADEITAGKTLDGLVYLHAVMDETMRRCPPKPSHVPREVLPGGITIDGDYIPEGIVVGVPAYAIHMNPECYPDPWSFRPERWIVNEEAGVSAESVALANRSFCPFSLGIRGCIGKTLAYMEYKTALAHVLWKYDIRQAEGETAGEGNPDLEVGRRRVDEYQIVDIIGVLRHGPMVEFKLADH